MTSTLQHLSTLFSLITITYSNHVKLTPISTKVEDTSVITNINEVEVFGTEWLAHTQSEKGWQFIILVDSSFGFHDTYSSSITVTINSNQPTFSIGDELLFGISTVNSEYISFKIPLFSEQPNKIYPSCIPSHTSTQLFATGDVAAVPHTNRDCDVAGGSCTNWGQMFPPNVHFEPSLPISFQFENNPEKDTSSVHFRAESFPSEFQQNCYFGNSFLPNRGLKIYISASNPSQAYTISSFDITSNVHYPATPQPSTSPTQNPSITPTIYPSISPTNNPTTIKPTLQPTKTPTKFPTTNPLVSPTNNPTTTKPTLQPTKNPTKFPTPNPTSNPTVSPIKNPTITPTINPTKYPTINPTKYPTVSPTSNPTKFPTVTPTANPTKYPTVNPTKNPTITPTLQTEYPTSSPTNNPIANGYKLGAYDQLCQWNSNKKCNEVSDTLIGQTISCPQPYDCCMCQHIQCESCNEFRVGRNGIYGVKDVSIAGNINGLEGAHILCEYAESCKDAVIDALAVSYIKCDETQSCQNAIITITDPKPNFVLECAGFASCEGLEIYIDLITSLGECETGPGTERRIFELSKIKCNNEKACNGMKITVNNEGCDYVRIGELECALSNSCNEAVFKFIGDVFIEKCKCGSSCDTATGLNQCFQNLQKYECSNPGICQGTTKTITNPAEWFEFICSDYQSCENANFVIELNSNIRSKVSNLKGLFMNGYYAARDATFIFENTQGIELHVEKMECGGFGSCNGFQVITGPNVFIDNIICSANSCIGCEIKETINSPAIPCDASQLQI